MPQEPEPERRGRETQVCHGQIEGARAFISSKGWTLHEQHVYSDDNVSGALFTNRPQFQRMMVDAEAGVFEAIMFFDIDRFGRDGRRSMEALYTLADLDVSIWDYSTGQERAEQSLKHVQWKHLLSDQPTSYLER